MTNGSFCQPLYTGIEIKFQIYSIVNKHSLVNFTVISVHQILADVIDLEIYCQSRS